MPICNVSTVRALAGPSHVVGVVWLLSKLDVVCAHVKAEAHERHGGQQLQIDASFFLHPFFEWRVLFTSDACYHPQFTPALELPTALL